MDDLSYIAEGLRNLAVPIDSLHEDAANARVGHDVERIASSLAQFGQRKPLIVNKAQGNKIEAGNGTFRAAKSLGWNHIAALFFDEDPATAAAYGIADNRTGEFSRWDPDALEDLVGTVGDLFTGFTQDELDEVIGRDGKAKPMDDPGPQEKSAELQAKWMVEAGDIWQLGEHLLFCGDSSDTKLTINPPEPFLGISAALTFTSPPYWVGKSYETQESEAEIDQFIERVAGVICALTRPDYSRIVINTGTGFTTSFDKRNKRQVLLLIDKWTKALYKQGWNLRHVRHWLKGGLLSAHGTKTDLIDQHCEFLGTYEQDEGKPMAFDDLLNEQDVNLLLTFYERSGKSRGQNRTGFGWVQKSYWDDLRGTASANGHVAAFPVELPMRHLLMYTKRGEIVFEPFCGSGTTVIACEILGRKCRAIELDPAYCAATLERWSIMTGQTPVKEAWKE
jgi:DNA modification methylase